MSMLTTEAVRPQDRFAYWREVVCQQVRALRVEPAGDGPFLGEVETHSVGDLPVMRIVSGGQRLLRTRVEIARSHVPYYFLYAHIDGSARLRRREEEIALLPGDMFILDSLHEHELGAELPSRALGLRLPKEWIDAQVSRPDLIPGTVLRHDQPLTRLLRSYLAEGFDNARQFSARAAAIFAEHSVELIADALTESWDEQPTPSKAWREALYVRACRLIRVRFGHADLEPGQMARALGVSMRLLQVIFAERGETIMKRVFEERVNCAARLLVAPEAAQRSITEIAFSCGFNDSSHFSRVFAARMGMTPSEWRKRPQTTD